MASPEREQDRDNLLIGLRLRDVRLQYGYSLERFAEQLSVSASHLSNIECGRKPPSLEVLTKVAKAFDISLDYLILGRQDRQQGNFLIFRSDDELLKTFVLVPPGTRSDPSPAR